VFRELYVKFRYRRFLGPKRRLSLGTNLLIVGIRKTLSGESIKTEYSSSTYKTGYDYLSKLLPSYFSLIGFVLSLMSQIGNEPLVFRNLLLGVPIAYS
jgi:hypothetical protein